MSKKPLPMDFNCCICRKPMKIEIEAFDKASKIADNPQFACDECTKLFENK